MNNKLVYMIIVVGILFLFLLNILAQINNISLDIQRNYSINHEIKEMSKTIEEIELLANDERVLQIQKSNLDLSNEINKIKNENTLISENIDEITNNRLDILNTEWQGEVVNLMMNFPVSGVSRRELTGILNIKITETGVIITISPEDSNAITTLAEIVAVDESMGLYTIKSLKDNASSSNFGGKNYYENNTMTFYVTVKNEAITCFITLDYYGHRYSKAVTLKRL